MTISVHSLQSVQSQDRAEAAVQPPKTPQAEAAAQNTFAQDSVTISQEARQALTHSTTDAGGGGPNDFTHSP